MPSEVFLLVSWDERSDDVIAVCSTLERAQQRYLDERYPSKGPRGGARPAQPTITWTQSSNGHDQWTPSGETTGHWQGHYIERREVDSQPTEATGA